MTAPGDLLGHRAVRTHQVSKLESFTSIRERTGTERLGQPAVPVSPAEKLRVTEEMGVRNIKNNFFKYYLAGDPAKLVV